MAISYTNGGLLNRHRGSLQETVEPPLGLLIDFTVSPHGRGRASYASAPVFFQSVLMSGGTFLLRVVPTHATTLQSLLGEHC